MDNIDTVKKYIDSQSESFFEYLRVCVIDDDAYKILEKASKESDIFLFSGVIRDYFLHKYSEIRDIDFVISKRVKLTDNFWEFINDRFKFEVNSFKGLKLINMDGGPNVDIWLLNHTWGIRHKRIINPTPNALIETSFFNFSCIVYDFNRKKFIFNDKFADFLMTQTIDTAYEINPNLSLCLLNLFHYSIKLQMPFSPHAIDWIRKYMDYIDDYSLVQKKHFGKVLYDNDSIKKYFKDLI